MKNTTYPKGADLCCLFFLHLHLLLLVTLPRDSDVHTPEKATTELIITRLDNSNKIHPCLPKKRGGGRWGGVGWGRDWRGWRTWMGKGWGLMGWGGGGERD